MTPTPNNTPQTLSEQLFGPTLNKVLWLLLLAFLIIGLIGCFWDLADANIFGTGQGLDSGSASVMVIGALIIGLFFLLMTLFGKEQRDRRGLK